MTHSIRLLTPDEKAVNDTPINYHYNGLNYATQADADEAARRDQAACAMQRKQNQLMALEGWPS